ncbi:MAG: class I SAM-dependent methyltransferase [Actinomycetota bacterium]
MSNYHDHCRHDVLALLPTHNGRVLDVGCGSGATGAELLATGRASAVDGIELSPTAAERAGARYGTVVVGPLETVDRNALADDYDTIMCNDVLEHLADPWSVLRSLVDHHLRPGGTVVVSVPNVQCAEVVVPLLAGRFDYADDGVLDRTHLRFFTRRTARALVASAGLTVDAEATSRIGAGRGSGLRLVGRLAGPFGVRQLLLTGADRRPAMDRSEVSGPLPVS